MHNKEIKNRQAVVIFGDDIHDEIFNNINNKKLNIGSKKKI